MVTFENEDARTWVEMKGYVQHQLNLFDVYPYQICS